MFNVLFGKKQHRSGARRRENLVESGKGGIRYDPELIAELKSDHAYLGALFKQISTNAAKRDPRSLAERLEEISHTLVEHLLKENVLFYVYLKNHLPADGSKIAMAQTFAREMPKIGGAVTEFLNKYSKIEKWNNVLWSAFESDLAEIITVLSRRVSAEEESLYPLYLSPGEYL